MVNLFKYLLLKSCNTIIRKIATLILLGSFSHLVSGIYFISFNFYWNQNLQWEIYNGIGKILFWQSLCKTKENFENLIAPFYGWFQLCQSCRATTLLGDCLLFTNESRGVPGAHFINLEGTKGWVNLAATQSFWTQDPWIANPAP